MGRETLQTGSLPRVYGPRDPSASLLSTRPPQATSKCQETRFHLGITSSLHSGYVRTNPLAHSLISWHYEHHLCLKEQHPQLLGWLTEDIWLLSFPSSKKVPGHKWAKPGHFHPSVFQQHTSKSFKTDNHHLILCLCYRHPNVLMRISFVKIFYISIMERLLCKAYTKQVLVYYLKRLFLKR